jgi:ABC-2 type transport system permease protein
MKLWAIIRREYKERVKSKGFVISTVLIPLLMSLTIVIPMLMGERVEERRTVAVLDSEGRWFDELERVLLERTGGGVELREVQLDGRALEEGAAEIQDLVVQGDVNGGIVFDPGFMENGKLRFYVKSVAAGLASDSLRPAVNAVLRKARFAEAGISEDLTGYLLSYTDWERLTVSQDGDATARDERGVFGMAMTLIMILYMMVLLYGQQTLTGVIEEKTSRVVEVLLSSVPSWQMMLGKILGIGAAGLTQVAIWTGSLYIASTQGISIAGVTFDASVLSPMILVSFLVFFVLGFLMYSALFAGVGALCNTIQEAQPFSTPIMMFIIIPMLMLTVVMRDPGGTLATVMSLIPLFTPVLMFIRVILETPPLWQVALSWVLLLATIILFSRTAGKLFRVGILMHGAAPSWGTLVKVMRQAD